MFFDVLAVGFLHSGYCCSVIENVATNSSTTSTSASSRRFCSLATDALPRTIAICASSTCSGLPTRTLICGSLRSCLTKLKCAINIVLPSCSPSG